MLSLAMAGTEQSPLLRHCSPQAKVRRRLLPHPMPLCRPCRCPHRAAATHAALQPWPPVLASAAAASFRASTPPWAAWQPPPPLPRRGARGATPLRPCFTAATTCRRATPPPPRSLLWLAPRFSDGLLCFDSRGGLRATIRRKGGSYLQCYRLI